MELKKFQISAKEYTVKTLNNENGFFELEINEHVHQIKLIKFLPAQNLALLQVNGQPYKVFAHKSEVQQLTLYFSNFQVNAKLVDFNKKTKSYKNSTDDVSKSNDISSICNQKSALLSPLTGRIIKILVKVGDMVTKNQPLLSIESMKMENEVRSPIAAFIKSILILEGNLVQQSQVLVTFEKEGEVDAGKFTNP